MSVRLPDDDVAFYWPPPTSCRRGNVPNSKSASLRSCGRILTPGPGTVKGGAHRPARAGGGIAGAAGSGAQCGWRARQGGDSVDMAWTRSPGDLTTIAWLPVNL